MSEINNGKIEINSIFYDRYRILRVLGSGGMGTVYLAEDLRLKGKQWVIKEVTVPEEISEQFSNEAKVLLSIRHPSLPSIIDYYPPDYNNKSYLIMDYIKGKTLAEVYESHNKNLSLQTILRYALQLTELLDYLHNKQPSPIIYRDLKPSNIIIDEQDNVKMIDFGIARSYKVGKKEDTFALGTIGFAAPEQFEDKQTDQRTDIYQLGALIYYLLAHGEYYSSTKPLTDFRNDLPHDLIWVLRQMLKNNPDDRYQNIVDVKKEIEQIQNHFYLDPTEALTSSPKNKKTVKNSKINTNGVQKEFPAKLILVANLSKRAGSTFVTVNLAKYLSNLGLATNVLELPFEPYIFDYIGLEQYLGDVESKNPPNHHSYPHLILEGSKIDKEKEVIFHSINWMVTDPRLPLIDKNMWEYQHMIKFLYSSRKANITIIDIGDYFEHKSVEAIIDEADLILIIVDPMPSEIMNNRTKLENILSAKSELPYEFVINRFTKGVNKKELLSALQVEPLAFIPAINLSYIHTSVYECNIPYSYQEVKNQLEKPLENITAKIISDPTLYKKDKDISLFSKLFRRSV